MLNNRGIVINTRGASSKKNKKKKKICTFGIVPMLAHDSDTANPVEIFCLLDEWETRMRGPNCDTLARASIKRHVRLMNLDYIVIIAKAMNH